MTVNDFGLAYQSSQNSETVHICNRAATAVWLYLAVIHFIHVCFSYHNLTVNNKGSIEGMDVTEITPGLIGNSTQEKPIPNYICTDMFLLGVPMTVYLGLFIPITLVGLSGNILVILVSNRKMNSTKMYMVALAVADTTSCIMYLTRMIMLKLNSHSTSCTIILILACFMATTMIYACHILACVAIERCLSATKPNLVRLSTNRAKMLCVFAVPIAILEAGLYFSTFVIKYFYRIYRIINVVLFAIPLFSIMLAYLAMLIALVQRNIKAARRNRRKFANNQVIPVPSLSHENKTHTSSVKSKSTENFTENASYGKRNEIGGHQINRSKSKMHINRGVLDRVTAMLILVTMSFLILWTPVWLSVFHLPLPPLLSEKYIITSIVNPFIYSFMSTDFRNELKSLFSKK